MSERPPFSTNKHLEDDSEDEPTAFELSITRQEQRWAQTFVDAVAKFQAEGIDKLPQDEQKEQIQKFFLELAANAPRALNELESAARMQLGGYKNPVPLGDKHQEKLNESREFADTVFRTLIETKVMLMSDGLDSPTLH